MGPSRRVIYFSLLLLLFTTGGVPVRAWSSERTSSQDYSRYQLHLVQIERVARRLLEAVPQSPPVQFILAAGEPTINAGATFGKILLSSGMMEFLRSDDELAMILGHELAHITQGHVVRGAMNSALLGIGSSLASAVFPGAGVTTDRGSPECDSGVFSSHPSSVKRASALKKRADQLALRSDRAWRTGSVTRFGRDEVACRRAKPHFYRARESLNLTEKVTLYRQGLLRVHAHILSWPRPIFRWTRTSVLPRHCAMTRDIRVHNAGCVKLSAVSRRGKIKNNRANPESLGQWLLAFRLSLPLTWEEFLY